MSKTQNTMKPYEAWLKLWDKFWPKMGSTQGFHIDQVAARLLSYESIHLGRPGGELKHS